MRFPLEQNPFEPVQLSSEDCERYETLATSLLQDTIADYQRFVTEDNRVLDRRRWKPIKTRESVTVFKDSQHATRAPPPGTHAMDTAIGGAAWNLPKLLAVGVIHGSLDDVMYGAVNPDADTIKIKTAYVNDEIVDGTVLCRIKTGTDEDPFRFLGLKWLVKSHSPTMNVIVWPRDGVFLESTGIHVLPNGDRVGYHIMHSVEVPQCPELRHLGILRSRVSSCYLYKQLRPRAVEVFMQTLIEPGGSAPDSMLLNSLACGLIGCWKTVWCAQNKKLTWLLEEAEATRLRAGDAAGASRGDQVVVRTNNEGKQCCATCTKTISHRTFRKDVACALCRVVVCNKCRTGRKLYYVRRNGSVKHVTRTLCNACITRSNRVSSAGIARYQFVPNARDRRRVLRDETKQVDDDVADAVLETSDAAGTADSSSSSGMSDDNDLDDEISVETIEVWEAEQIRLSTMQESKET
ncbi:hypothetical protein P43SY_009393 [Pythium insidiosum]|uniref:Ig-like domain-containing protein n=1 Tax=Pythium insidiosum TaxID=114742 RepID=A0AAD5LYU5_PYTIN|nr:hypothetical protein P43SY_009393 [Pythium insidiosum]